MNGTSNRRNFLKTSGTALGGLIIACPIVSQAAHAVGKKLAQAGAPPSEVPPGSPPPPNPPTTNPGPLPNMGTFTPNYSVQGFYGIGYGAGYYGTGYYSTSGYFYSGYYGQGFYNNGYYYY